jgi:hypothetical protein
MSSTNLVARAVVLAGLAGALSLPSTARAQSVTPERALLNQWPAVSATAFARFQAPAAAQPAVIDGERALLSRSHTVILTVESATPVIADAPVDGVKALLNRSSS